MSEKILHETRFVRLVERNGWTYVTRPRVTGIVTIVAVTDDGAIVLVEQHRDAVGCAVVELPAGLVGDDPSHPAESLEAAARRELLEETGFECARVARLASGTTSPGITDDRLAVFRAFGLRRSGEGGGVDGERITVHVVQLARLSAWLLERERAGSVVDLKIYAGLWLAGLHRQ